MQMADAVTSAELERVIDGEVLTKQLADYGEAIFILGKVLSIDDKEIMCDVADVRRVLKG